MTKLPVLGFAFKATIKQMQSPADQPWGHFALSCQEM
jgi:hypothetical protein